MSSEREGGVFPNKFLFLNPLVSQALCTLTTARALGINYSRVALSPSSPLVMDYFVLNLTGT